MKCWICGELATTGEHILKASDLKSEFGSVSQKNPLFFNSRTHTNTPINSIKKSKLLKSKGLICKYCNNARTSNNDRAWEELSLALRNIINLRKGSIISLNKIFPGNTKNKMLHVHLFFLKEFGCAIKEHEIPIDINFFKEAILNVEPHPHVFLSFGVADELNTGSTDVFAVLANQECVFAFRFYIIGKIAVKVVYAKPDQNRQGLRNTWHPRVKNKLLKISSY